MRSHKGLQQQKRSFRLSLLLLFLLSIPSHLFARDFPDPIPVFDALDGIQPNASPILPSSFLQLRYDNFALLPSETDDFHIQVLGSFGLFQYQGIFALKLSYGTVLIVGPLAAGDTPASTAEWWMNSVQFQYGIYGAMNLRGFHILSEYSRQSNHPLRIKRTNSESFENPASERIVTGIVLPPLEMESISCTFYYRTGFVDLFDYWKAKDIPEPRTFWLHRLGFEAVYYITPNVEGFLAPVIDLLALREGGWDIAWKLDVGFALNSGSQKLKLFLTAVWNNDTEEIVEKSTPIRLVGLGFSLSSGNTSLP